MDGGVAVTFAATPLVLRTRVADVTPAATVTVAGTVTLGSLLERCSVVLAVVLLAKVIVAMTLLPPTTEVGVMLKALSIGVMVKRALAVPWPRPEAVSGWAVI